jgi:hypothetical protein
MWGTAGIPAAASRTHVESRAERAQRLHISRDWVLARLKENVERAAVPRVPVWNSDRYRAPPRR